MREEWLEIPGFEGYEASTEGRIYNKKKKTYIGSMGSRGVRVASLWKEGTCYQMEIGKLVAITFLGGHAPGETVLHKNQDRSDDRLDNLQWATRAAITRSKGGYGKHRRVRIIELGLVFKNSAAAGRHVEANHSDVQKCLGGWRRTAKGYSFEYAD